MVHSVLIVGHALCGVVALLVGCFILKPPVSSTSLLFRIYAAGLVGLIVLMLAVVAYDWTALHLAQQITFAGLCALGIYTGRRALQAHRELASRQPGWQARYVDHVGFTLISLFDGFTIVAAVDRDAPLPVVLLVGALGVVAGIAAMNVAKSRLRVVATHGARVRDRPRWR